MAVDRPLVGERGEASGPIVLGVSRIHGKGPWNCGFPAIKSFDTEERDGYNAGYRARVLEDVD